MNWKSVAKSLFKGSVTVGIFVLLFAEFGGGKVEVDRQGLLDGSILYQPNPEMPGFVGRMKAKVTGAALPEATAPVSYEEACEVAIHEPIFAKTTAGEIVKIKGLKHCVDGKISRVLANGEAEELVALDTTAASKTVWLVKQGSQRVPMDVQDLVNEISSISLGIFIPWMLFATLVKLAGIFANIWRWQILLNGQGMKFGFWWLTASYFIGRFFGIVMPSTMGLDGWRLYDTIRMTQKPVECTTVIAVERVIGLVGLLATILLFMPFADLGGRGLGELLAAMAVPLASALVFAMLLLLQPGWMTPIVKIVPHARVRSILQSAIESATAYSAHRGALLLALACAVFGQVTTMFMYFGTAMAVDVENVTMIQVLYASAVMTLGTFLTPSAAGEGVRELVFVELLGGHTTAAKAFLIGNLGFWIEKLFLSFQGGVFLIKAPPSYERVSYADMQKVKAEADAARAAQAATGA